MDREQQRLSGRLAFLALLATLWKIVALQPRQNKLRVPRFPTSGSRKPARIGSGCWQLAAAIGRHPIAATSASYEALLDYDRRRLVRETILEKVTATIVANLEAELLLSAVAGGAEKEPLDTDKTFFAGPATIAIWSAILRGDSAGVQRYWGAYLAEIALQPLLYVPLARGRRRATHCRRSGFTATNSRTARPAAATWSAT